MRTGRLKAVREQKGLSQRELAAQCGFGEKQIWRYENGESDPSSEHLAIISRVLAVTADYLIGLVDDPHKHLEEQALTPMERKLIDAVRNGFIVEALDTFAELSKKSDKTPVPH